MAKLVEVLARELKAWPEGVISYHQGESGSLYALSRGSAVFRTDLGWNDWCIVDHSCVMAYTAPLYGLEYDKCSDWNKVQVNRAMWQSERDRQKGGGWKRNRGKTDKSPVDDTEIVEVRFRNGVTEIDRGYPRWYHTGNHRDIMAYRVLEKPEQEEKEAMQEVKIQTGAKVEFARVPKGEVPKGNDWITLGYTTEAKIEYFDGPLKWLDGVAELEAYIEEFTRQRDDLVKRLEDEGFALIPAMTAVMGVADVDMRDWRNWKAGDIVQCVTTTGEHGGYYAKGGEYLIAAVDLCDDLRPVDVNCDRGFSLWCPSQSFKFIRRP